MTYAVVDGRIDAAAVNAIASGSQRSTISAVSQRTALSPHPHPNKVKISAAVWLGSRYDFPPLAFMAMVAD